METKPLLSFVIPAMGRLHHVKQALESVLKQPNSEVILVDWSCPEHTGDWAEATFKEKYPNLKVVRVPDKKHFHLSAARNIGAKEANGEFLCFLDCDMILKDNFLGMCLSAMDGDSYIIFDFYSSGYAGMIICPKKDFLKINGYDENIRGYGYEDDEFKCRISQLLLKSIISRNLANHIEHEDGERVKFYEEKDKFKSQEINKHLIHQCYLRRNNIVVPSQQQIPIPKIFHFIWIGRKRYPLLNENIQTWRNNHPNWSFFLWTDQEDLSSVGCQIRRIETLFPLKRQKIYDKIIVPAYKVDLLRLEIILQYGGVYVDVDFISQKKIDQTIEGFSGFTCIANNHINNAIFGAIPNSPWIAAMLNGVKDEYLCGPSAMTQITPSFPNIHVFEEPVFYSVTYDGKHINTENSLATHLWEHSFDKISPQSFVDWEPKQPIIHASGNTRNEGLFTNLKSKTFAISIPQDVTIITYSDGNNGPYLLEKQLVANGISYLIAKIDGKYHKEPFFQKLLALKDVLPLVKTKWVLSLDAFDVILQGDLREFIQETEGRDLNAFFGAEWGHWPPNCKTKEKEIALHPDSSFQFLNAGVGLIKLEWLKNRLIKQIEAVDDQAFFKETYVSEFPKVDIDHEAKFVLNLNGVKTQRLVRLAQNTFSISPYRYEVFVLTQVHRETMARKMVKSLIDHAAQKPNRIIIASMEYISDENWGPGTEVWVGPDNIKAELLKAGLSRETFSRIAGDGSEAGVRSKWSFGNGHMFLKYAIPRLCMGKRVLISDDDVIFRGPCFELFESGADMVFMDDPPGFYGEESIRLFLENGWVKERPQGPFVCAGFYLMNKKQATPEIVNKVILNAKNHRDEQSAVGMETMMGTVYVLQPPKYIHGGQICDGRIEARSETWMKDAEVIHMQGDLNYLRKQDLKTEKINNKNTFVLITSSVFVSPKVLALKPHIINDPKIRLQQLICTLLKWAKTTSGGIVLCDNSGVEMNVDVLKDYFDRFGMQLEILLYKETSDSNAYGFLEQCILRYAINNSRLLDRKRSFFKVTGRLFIENFDYIDSIHADDVNVFEDNEEWLDSRFFKIGYKTCVDFVKLIQENEYRNYTIEYLLNRIPKNTRVTFKTKPIFLGRKGSTDELYDADYDQMELIKEIALKVSPQLF